MQEENKNTIETDEDLEHYLASHNVHKSNWLRAAVLGANDGILSVASIAVGVAAASTTREPVVLASLAGLVAGALSMAAGEYVSVSSQTDLENADIQRERQELEEMPEIELKALAKIYEDRGLKKETAMIVAKEFTEHDALAAHVRDELGITDTNRPNPMEAALASGASFTIGGALPFVVSLFIPLDILVYVQYGAAILFLAMLGAVSAYTGGAPIGKAIGRISLWGTIAMVLSALVGHWFGVST